MMVNTTLCYIEKDGCWLMLHRVKKIGDMNRDKWIGLGGKFERGESPEDCVLREVREELGITEFTPTFVGKYVFESKRERELVYVHSTVYDGPIRPSKDELDGGRFWSMDELRNAIGTGVLTPNFESEFQRFFL